MRNKKTYIVFIVLICILICACGIKPIKQTISDGFWSMITKQFAKEEELRLKKVENGDIVRGKDTVLIWGNKFEIWNHLNEKQLSIEEKGISENILNKVTDFKTINEKLYIVSEEGFAVIDKNNLCRVYVTVANENFVNGYSTDMEGNKHYISRYIENEHIQYLSDFNEFSIAEQKMFNEIKTCVKGM